MRLFYPRICFNLWSNLCKLFTSDECKSGSVCRYLSDKTWHLSLNQRVVLFAIGTNMLLKSLDAQISVKRYCIHLCGAVQGVGFRPFVYRLARELDLCGWVMNSAQGVFIEVEGPAERLEAFLSRLQQEKPPRAAIHSMEYLRRDVCGYRDFEIRQSEKAGEKTAVILPDIATCEDCLRELFDPADRRYLYPFTNCTNCGPRFSIMEALPYDRPNTAMKRFQMCPACQQEYDDPASRRFHAQPNACPACGPHLELWDLRGMALAEHYPALLAAAQCIREGRIVALKGIGGFQLLVDARNAAAVQRLRRRKHREEKPFAVMFPSLEAVKSACEVSPAEARLLLSPAAPIVLLAKLKMPAGQIAAEVAPANPNLGVMLPYSPLHHLLLRELDFPVVATSGNLSDEPICIDENQARVRLQGIADRFLVHNRPIVRHVDDSIARILRGEEMLLRRARGYAPLPLRVPGPLPPVLAVGAHLKNTVALGVGHSIFISQHIGDLETAGAYTAFERVIRDFQHLYGVQPRLIACDLHPDYLSGKYAREMGPPVIPVQHHLAHVVAGMTEHQLEPPVLGISWDGTGYGADGTIWGGEFFLVEEKAARRVAHLRSFPLPGGEAAIRQPRRAALGVLYEMMGDALFDDPDPLLRRHFTESEWRLLRRMLLRKINCPCTSSAGRLFDAVAALTGLRQESKFEGQAAMALEFAVLTDVAEAYPFEIGAGEPAVIDWQPMMTAICNDLREDVPAGVIAARFHNALVAIMLAVARKVDRPRIVLSGGCFQNQYLTGRAVTELAAAGFRPYWHRCIPPNDGGIAVGQLMAVIHKIAFVPNHTGGIPA